MMMKKLTERHVYDTTRTTYFGWDLRESDWETVIWKRWPKLSADDIANWPYRFESGKDMVPDFCIVVQGDPSDELLSHWLQEDERGAPTSVAVA